MTLSLGPCNVHELADLNKPNFRRNGMSLPLKSALYAVAFLLAPLAASADDGCTSSSPYPPSLVKNFMKRCESQPDMHDFCECVIRKLQNKISLYDFIELDDSSTLQSDARFKDSGSECADRLKHQEQPEDK